MALILCVCCLFFLFVCFCYFSLGKEYTYWIVVSRELSARYFRYFNCRICNSAVQSVCYLLSGCMEHCKKRICVTLWAMLFNGAKARTAGFSWGNCHCRHRNLLSMSQFSESLWLDSCRESALWLEKTSFLERIFLHYRSISLSIHTTADRSATNMMYLYMNSALLLVLCEHLWVSFLSL